MHQLVENNLYEIQEDSGKVHIAAESAAKRFTRVCLGREGGGEGKGEGKEKGRGGGGTRCLADRGRVQKRGHEAIKPPEAMLTKYLRAVSTILSMPLPSIQHFLPAELGWKIPRGGTPHPPHIPPCLLLQPPPKSQHCPVQRQTSLEIIQNR